MYILMACGPLLVTSTPCFLYKIKMDRCRESLESWFLRKPSMISALSTSPPWTDPIRGQMAGATLLFNDWTAHSSHMTGSSLFLAPRLRHSCDLGQTTVFLSSQPLLLRLYLRYSGLSLFGSASLPWWRSFPMHGTLTLWPQSQSTASPRKSKASKKLFTVGV